MAAEALARFENPDGQSVVEFVLGENREIFLTIGGERAFSTGYWICDTCRYVFTKLMPAQKLTDGTSEEAAAQLSADLRNMGQMPSERVLRKFAAVLAPGTYSVTLSTLVPELVMPGDEKDYFTREAIETWDVDTYFGVGHSPQTPYYRLGSADLGQVDYGGKRLGVALAVPLFPPTQRYMNHRDTIERYRTELQQGNTQPTVLAVGLADDRGPATWPDPPPKFSRHLIVTLYILDGHHKIAAAAEDHRPIQFLAFIPHKHVDADWSEPVAAGINLLTGLSSA